MTIEVFNRDQQHELVSSLTKLIGSLPDGPSNPSGATSAGKSRTTIDVTKWTLDNAKVERVFSEDARRFQVDIRESLPIYRTVRVFLIGNPTMPFLLFVILGELLPEKIDPSIIRDQLRRASVPFRLFVEKLPGLSSHGRSWSPHVANVIWTGVIVDAIRISRLRKNLSRLSESRQGGIMRREEQDAIESEIRNDEPFDLADPAVKITSHMLTYQNLHPILSQAEQPGLSAYRTLSILYLTTERGLLSTFPDVRSAFLPAFPSRVDWSPMFGESILAWLLGINIWANNRELVASNLDQRAMALRQSPSVNSTSEEIGKMLSDVSLLGTDAAIASGEVNLVKRLSASLLSQLVAGGPLALEIPLRIRDPFILEDVTKSGEHLGVVSTLGSMTRESLEAAGEHLREVESEVAIFQRHISDIANLQPKSRHYWVFSESPAGRTQSSRSGRLRHHQISPGLLSPH
jgi:hypothetical protein